VLPDLLVPPAPTPVPRMRPTLEPSTPLYLTGEDAIRLTVFNAAAGVTVALAGRFLSVADPNDPVPPVVGPFVHSLVPATNRTASTRTEVLGEGWLLDGQVSVTAGNPAKGQTFAIVTLVRGKSGAVQETTVIAAGYIGANARLPIVNGNVTSAIDGEGALRSITGTTPAAGAEILETVPTGARWEPIALRATLVTSAAAANRIPDFILDDGVNILWRAPQGAAQTASLTEGYQLAQGLVANFNDTVTTFFQCIPIRVMLGAGFRIRSSTSAIQAGDQWSAPQYLVREWIEVN